MKDLEQRIGDQPTSPTLQQELIQSIRNYPGTWVNYTKNLAPALGISMLGAAAGQWAITEMGYQSHFATTGAAYVCGYIPGYATFFTLEFLKNRAQYPKLLSRKFGEFVGTFLAADWVADVSTFTPAFIASNIWLTDHTDLHPAVRSLVAWGASSLLYISAMSALHPVARRANQKLNKGIKSLWHRAFSRSSNTITPS